MEIKPIISIVIITKNEEVCLPKLFKSIINQSYKNYEVLVCDGGSTDKTEKITNNFNAKFILTNKNHTISRNIGAKISKGEWILFLDADVELPKKFLSNIIQKSQRKNLICSTSLYNPISKNPIDWFLYYLYNFYALITQYFYPHSSGFCIFVRKKEFMNIGGFDKKLKVAEDFDMVKRISKIGKFRVLMSLYLWNDIRRIRKWGRWKLIKNYLFAEYTRTSKGEMYDGAPFEYTLQGGTKIGK